MTWEEAKQKGIEGRLELLLNGQSPVLLTKMPSGFAVMGDFQHLPGYCLLLAYPVVFSIDVLPLEGRLNFLQDMMLVGQAVSEVCQPLRMNYSILGNGEPFLHAHVRPRYAWEADKYRKGPYDRYPDKEKYHSEVAFETEKHEALRLKIQKRLLELQKEYA
jgi:diadenosine tetraphosphate (Ap4A) HIT family hydrolase